MLRQIVDDLQIIEKIVRVVGENPVGKKRNRDGSDRRERHRSQGDTGQ